jgi:hypothetical protein
VEKQIEDGGSCRGGQEFRHEVRPEIERRQIRVHLHLAVEEAVVDVVP